MIKIFTDEINKFKKILSQTYVKGDFYKESVFLNFKNSHIYFNARNYFGRFSFRFEASQEDLLKLTNIYVNIPLLITLSQQYKILLFDVEELEFSSEDGDKFKIPIFKEDALKDFFEEKDSMNYQSEYKSYKVSLNENIDFIEKLKLASDYMGTEESSSSAYENYYAIQLNNNSIVSTNASAIFEAGILESSEFAIDIPGFLVKLILLSTSFSSWFTLFYKKNKNIIISFGNNDLEILCAESLNVNIPSLEDEEFVSKFHHKTYISFNRLEMLEVLKFFKEFVKEETNERLYININKDNLIIEAKDSIRGSRKIDSVLNEENLINQSLCFPRFLLVKALESLNTETVKLELNLEMPAFNVLGVKEINDEKLIKDTHIAIIRLEE